jgi:glycosyltransferase involved in cell wall biosynthesis
MKFPFRKQSRGADHLLVISQLPPPVHGSTVMTEVFLTSLDRLNVNWTLVDRRFSASIDSVGRITLRKALAAVGLIGRLIRAIAGKHAATAIVFFCTTRPVSFFVDWMLSEIIRISRISTINYIHTRGYRDLAAKNVLLHLMVKRMLGVASQTVCLSPSLYSDISPWVPADTVSFIANTPRDMPTELGEHEIDSRRVTFLSNLLPGKGIDTFLDIAIRLSPQHPDVVFDVIGASTDENQSLRLQAVARDAGVGERFNFAGAVYGDEKWNYLRRSTLLVFPSQQMSEAQPLTIIEAFACATPVVAFKIEATVDLIVDGQTGVLVEPLSSSAMFGAVDTLLSSPDLLTAYGRQAASEFARRFSYETYQRQWSKVLSIDP